MSMRTLALAACLAVAACSPADDHAARRRADRHVEAGKLRLADGEWRQARLRFEAALAEVPDHGPAHFGAAMTRLLPLVDVMRYGAEALGRAVGGSLSLAPADSEESRYIVELVGSAIEAFRSDFAAADVHLAAALAEPGLRFSIGRLPIRIVADAEPIDLAGDWDAADATLLRAVAELLEALATAAGSIDLRFDFDRAQARLDVGDLDLRNAGDFLSFVVFLLDDPDFPNLLGTRPEDGAVRMNTARLRLADAAMHAADALRMAAAEGEASARDVLRYVGAPGALPAPGEVVEICGEGAPEAGAARFRLFSLELADDGTGSDPVAALVCLLHRLEANLRDGDADPRARAMAEPHASRPRLSLRRDLVPVVDLAISEGARLLPILPGSISLPPGVFEAIATDLLGNGLELDPAAFFQTDDDGDPGNLRDLLPTWNAGCADDPGCRPQFDAAMECAPTPVSETSLPLPLDELLRAGEPPICRAAWLRDGAAADGAHRGGAVAADGILSYVPWLGMRSPDLHGVLWLDTGALAGPFETSSDEVDRTIGAALRGLADPAGFALPDVRTFNAAVAGLTSNRTVGGLLQTAAGFWGGEE